MRLLLLISTLAPQDPAPVAPPSAGETVVVAPRAEVPGTATAAQVVRITGRELERTGERSLPRALGAASGVWVQETNLGGGAPILRGLVGNQVLILVDGVRLNDSTTRTGPNQSLNQIDPATVEAIEIVRGPSSVLYGSDAIGGTILVWTKRGLPGDGERPRGFLELEAGSAFEGGRASVGAGVSGGRFGALAIASGRDFDDIRPGGGGTIDPTGYHGNAVFGSFETALDERRSLRATASSHRDFDVPRTDRLITGFGQTAPADVEWDYALQERERFLLVFDDRAGPAESMQVRLSFRRSDEERRTRAAGSSVRRLEDDEVDTLGLGVDWRRSLGEHLLTWGFDVDHDEVDSRRRDIDLPTGNALDVDGTFAPDSRYTSTGVFVQDELFAFEPFLVTAGLRWSWFDFAFDDFGGGGRQGGDFDAITASLQVARELFDGARLSATLAQGFRAPNLSELAKNNSFSGGEQLANPDLVPEESLMGELAFELGAGPWHAAFAAHHTEIDDTIGRVLIDPGGPQNGDELYLRENVGSLRVSGLEAAVRRRLGASDSPWSVTSRAEWTRGRVSGGDPARRIPPLFGTLGIDWEAPRSLHGIQWARMAWVFAFEQDELNPEDLDDPRIDPDGTDGWSRIDVEVGGPLGRAAGSRWSLGLLNVFDERYRLHGSGHDAPGLGVVLGLHVSL